MISKNQIKSITALSLKKNRDESGLFIAEGTKIVSDLKQTFQMKECYATHAWLDENKSFAFAGITEISEVDYQRISSQKSPQGILAVFHRPAISELPNPGSELILALDDVQDPGNLGTIIRIADWFGIGHILCSLRSADAFSAKTVQATMGALARVNVHYVDLEMVLSGYAGKCPVYGTFMQGANVYKAELSNCGIVVMGNEGNGISLPIQQFITEPITIPAYPADVSTSESLNVAVACSIVCSEFRRRL